MSLTLEMIADVQWLMLHVGPTPRLERIETYLLRRYMRS